VVNIFFVGDELVAGYGDARALGWTGRVLARTSNEPPLMPLTLAIPGENTDSLAKRWAEEVGRRIHPEEDNRLVLGLGSHDLDSGQTLARARLHLANTLDAALRLRLRSFVVGPPPRRDVPRKIQEDLTRWRPDLRAEAWSVPLSDARDVSSQALKKQALVIIDPTTEDAPRIFEAGVSLPDLVPGQIIVMAPGKDSNPYGLEGAGRDYSGQHVMPGATAEEVSKELVSLATGTDQGPGWRQAVCREQGWPWRRPAGAACPWHGG